MVKMPIFEIIWIDKNGHEISQKFIKVGRELYPVNLSKDSVILSGKIIKERIVGEVEFKALLNHISGQNYEIKYNGGVMW